MPAPQPAISVSAQAGWTNHVVTPETGVRAVDGLLTGLHEPRSSHLRMLAAFHPGDLLERCPDGICAVQRMFAVGGER